jgi:hypothetical protein
MADCECHVDWGNKSRTCNNVSTHVATHPLISTMQYNSKCGEFYLNLIAFISFSAHVWNSCPSWFTLFQSSTTLSHISASGFNCQTSVLSCLHLFIETNASKSMKTKRVMTECTDEPSEHFLLFVCLFVCLFVTVTLQLLLHFWCWQLLTLFCFHSFGIITWTTYRSLCISWIGLPVRSVACVLLYYIQWSPSSIPVSLAPSAQGENFVTGVTFLRYSSLNCSS